MVKQADSSLRYLIHRTRLNILVIIQKEDGHELNDQNFFYLPLFVVPAFDLNDFDVKHLPIFDDLFDSAVRTEIIESTTLSEHARKIFFNLANSRIQLGTFGKIWDLEDAWGMPSTKPSRSPDSSEEVPHNSLVDSSEITTPINNSLACPDTPTASKCLAPKKRKIDRAYIECCRCKNSLNF